MQRSTLIDIHLNGQWVPAATLTQVSGDRCRIDYEPAYIFSDTAQPLSLNLPVGFQDLRHEDLHEGALERLDMDMPAFLYDLSPQGHGRTFLQRLLGIPDAPGHELDLLFVGAFNPIGRLRLRSAMDLATAHLSGMGSVTTLQSIQAAADMPASQGWTMQDMIERNDRFLDDLSMAFMLASGTTGVQGVAPKCLLTQDAEGLWHPDLTLDDGRAHSHWIMKMPRGRTREDRLVLHNEAAYLRVAQACGLRMSSEPFVKGDMLFVKRFDRQVVLQTDERQGVTRHVNRLHQESLASLAGLKGFGKPTTQNALLAALRQHASEKTAETIEFIQRDLLNRALRNTDNHARNTAIQVIQDGGVNRVQLTPLFDFAPMFKDPEVIARSVHWHDKRGRRTTDIQGIIDAIDCEDDERHQVAAALNSWASALQNLPSIARDCGVDEEVLQPCLGTIEDVLKNLAQLDARYDDDLDHPGRYEQDRSSST